MNWYVRSLSVFLYGCLLATYLFELCPFESCTAQDSLQFQRTPDRLVITTSSNAPVAEYVFEDAEILRPYFTRLHSPTGILLTRNHPPVAGTDATDHATMHPGIWLAIGDINGQDFWRNKAKIKHIRFTSEPTIETSQLQFATQCELISNQSLTIGRIDNRYRVVLLEKNVTAIVWQATFQALNEPLTFGDQEEMGFGVRMATPLIEKKGGQIVNSHNITSAAKTWGQEAWWCDYSGRFNDRACGITIVASPANFRPSRWHNRDYGLMVANPFAIAAMKQCKASPIVVNPDKPLTIAFAAVMHDGDYDPQTTCEKVKTLLLPSP